MRALVLAVALLAVVIPAPPVDAAVSLATHIVYRIRDVRHDSIPISLALSRTARIRATELAATDRLDDHAGFVAAATRAGVTRASWRVIGEVMGWHIRDGATARWFVRAWLDSRTHRAVVLGRWTHIGASCARNLERIYCVVIFGRHR